MTRPKNWRILSNTSRYTGLIFAIFSPYESTLAADDRSVPYFPICQGTLPWKRKNNGGSETRKNNEGGLIPHAFYGQVFENELEYHYLYVCINSSDDQATLVGF